MEDTENIAEWINDFLKSTRQTAADVEAVSIHIPDGMWTPRVRAWSDLKSCVVKYERAVELLNFDFECTYGMDDEIPYVIVFTPHAIYSQGEYDGKPFPSWRMRNPKTPALTEVAA